MSNPSGSRGGAQNALQEAEGGGDDGAHAQEEYVEGALLATLSGNTLGVAQIAFEILCDISHLVTNCGIRGHCFRNLKGLNKKQIEEIVMDNIGTLEMMLLARQITIEDPEISICIFLTLVKLGVMSPCTQEREFLQQKLNDLKAKSQELSAKIEQINKQIRREKMKIFATASVFCLMLCTKIVTLTSFTCLP